MPDLVTSFPFDLVIGLAIRRGVPERGGGATGGAANNLHKLVRVIRLFKLVRSDATHPVPS